MLFSNEDMDSFSLHNQQRYRCYTHSFTGVQQLIGVIERMILNIVMGCKCCTFQPEKQLHVLNVIVVVALHGELQLK